MRRGQGRGGALVGALLLLVVAAGCGDGTTPGAGSGEDGVEISTIADTTAAVGTARFEGTFTSAGGKQDGHFSGEIDFADDRSVVRHTGDGENGPYESEIRTVDGYTYFQAPDEGPDGVATPRAKPWMRARIGGAGPVIFPVGAGADVTGLLEVLDAMGAQVEVIGTEDVRGEPTTHYRFTSVDPPRPPAQVSALGEYDIDEDEDTTTEMWVDAENRLRRFVSFAADEGDDVDRRGSRYEFELFDFGAPVDVQAPPLDQVDTQVATAEPGAYEFKTSGSSEGTEWKVFFAPLEGGGCLAIEADVAEYFAVARRAADGDRIELGCSQSLSAGSTAGPDGVVSEVPEEDLDREFDEVDADAVPLADGRALLIADVPPETTAATFELRHGDPLQLTPENGYVAVALGADDVVERMVFTTPDRTVRCRLNRGWGGYVCGDGVQFHPPDASDSTWSSGSISVPAR